ncbi:MAG TPA: serine hydrolase [Cytophagaceae bacterium]|nr:serine hydrolase [Cytophagaceae bacterium]
MKAQKKAGFLEDLLLKEDTSQAIYQVLYNPREYKLQIIYTQVNRDKNNRITFSNYSYGDSSSYFYPASLVKLPVAALSLEKLKSLNGVVDRNSILETHVRCLENNDTTNAISTIAGDITEMMVISDNIAFNHQYEFLGQEHINLRLEEMGYKSARIIQRFASCDDEEQRRTGPFQFIDTLCNQVLYEEGVKVNGNQMTNSFKNPKVGKSYYDGKKLIKKPRNFTYSNAITLKDLTGILISIIYPEAVPAPRRFDIKPDDLIFLKKTMSILPRETDREEWHDSIAYYDGFRKFLIYADTPARIPENIRIFNKVGLAYGFTSDCAYIVDYKNKVEFFLSALIYTNKDEILNDGKYEYTSIGLPFIAQLGRVIYGYELNNRKQSRVSEPLNYK